MIPWITHFEICLSEGGASPREGRSAALWDEGRRWVPPWCSHTDAEGRIRERQWWERGQMHTPGRSPVEKGAPRSGVWTEMPRCTCPPLSLPPFAGWVTPSQPYHLPAALPQNMWGLTCPKCGGRGHHRTLGKRGVQGKWRVTVTVSLRHGTLLILKATWMIRVHPPRHIGEFFRNHQMQKAVLSNVH